MLTVLAVRVTSIVVPLIPTTTTIVHNYHISYVVSSIYMTIIVLRVWRELHDVYCV